MQVLLRQKIWIGKAIVSFQTPEFSIALPIHIVWRKSICIAFTFENSGVWNDTIALPIQSFGIKVLVSLDRSKLLGFEAIQSLYRYFLQVNEYRCRFSRHFFPNRAHLCKGHKLKWIGCLGSSSKILLIYFPPQHPTLLISVIPTQRVHPYHLPEDIYHSTWDNYRTRKIA